MKSFACSLLLLLSFAANATDVLLTWEAPTQYTDGTPLSTIDGYNIYYSIDSVPQEPINVRGDQLEYRLTDIQSGTYYFEITTVAGLESERSAPVILGKPVKIILNIGVIY